MKLVASLAFFASSVIALNSAQAQTMLGSYTFNSSQFGDTLVQSDGGTFAAGNWLNTVNVDPGSPGYLTGANFNTGIANIGLGGTPVYTIGYSTPIFNGSGNDLGIVTARFSASDTISIAFSSDGTTFGTTYAIAPSAAVATGVFQDYHYGGSSSTYSAQLFVTALDLSSYGISADTSVAAVRITGAPELDLIRVAGFGDGATVPEPASWALMVLGFGAVGYVMRSRKVAFAHA